MATDDRIDRLNIALEGRYHVEKQIGEGGMAVVYLARDARHDRHVALKALKSELAVAVGAERFLGEIQLTAKLQHPHILPLFDSGEADGILYFVTPFVEGESVRDWLNRERQLPIDDVLALAAQVASALDYAHRHGIVHRDIKPENILIHEGSPMVADFGIARALSEAGTPHLTETGFTVGTPFYMSPEQAAGEQEVDGRSDEYSLACVVYEMLAGTPPFAGATPQAVLARKLSQDPPAVTKVRSSVADPMARVLEAALARIPADRFPTVTGFAEALADPTRTGPHTRRPGPAAARFALSGSLPWVIAVIAVAVLAWNLLPSRESDRLDLRVGLVLEDPAGAPATSLDISPDGRMVAYVAGRDSRIWLRSLDELTATPLPGTEGSFDPSFSPDGRYLAFAGPTPGEIRRIAVAGGRPVDVTDQAYPRYPRMIDWGDDGFIYFTHRDANLARVPSEGGEVEVLTQLQPELEGGYRSPSVLPNGRGVLFTIIRWPTFRDEVAVLDFESDSVRVLHSGIHARYVGSGHLVTVQSDGTVLATPFDADRLELAGASVAVGRTVGDAYLDLACSSNGTLLYWSGVGERGLVLVHRDGYQTWLGSNTAQALHPSVSPDGRWIAADVPGNNSIDIWVYDLQDSTFSRLTFEEDDIYPAWSADGESVLFARAPAGNPVGDWTIHRVSADGNGEARPYLDVGGSEVEIAESPVGEWLVYRQGDLARTGGADIYYVGSEGAGSPRPLAASRFEETSPVFSPDGRWLAYISNASGRYEVYAQGFPAGRRYRVSTDGGTEPVWARDGRSLFYRSDDGFLVQATLTATPPFAVVQRHRLFSTAAFGEAISHRAYDVLPGDSMFVFTGLSERKELVLVQDWFEELNERAGRN